MHYIGNLFTRLVYEMVNCDGLQFQNIQEIGKKSKLTQSHALFDSYFHTYITVY